MKLNQKKKKIKRMVKVAQSSRKLIRKLSGKDEKEGGKNGWKAIITIHVKN